MTFHCSCPYFWVYVLKIHTQISLAVFVLLCHFVCILLNENNCLNFSLGWREISALWFAILRIFSAEYFLYRCFFIYDLCHVLMRQYFTRMTWRALCPYGINTGWWYVQLLVLYVCVEPFLMIWAQVSLKGQSVYI